MRLAIVQIYVSLNKYTNPNILASFDELSEVSFKLAKNYAFNVKADYFLLTEPFINHLHPTYERFRLFTEDKWTQDYDQVLYLDSDVFIYLNSPNIFNLYPKLDTFKICRHWSTVRYGINDNSFNAGVFMLNKYSRDLMTPYLNYNLENPPSDHDNFILAECMKLSKVNYEFMDAKFNAKNSEIGYFCHAWGSGKRKNPNLPCLDKARYEASLC